MDTKQYQNAFAKFRADLAAAVKFTNSDLTHSAQTRRRHDGVMQARADLLKQIPPAPNAPGTNRSTVIAGLKPRTADKVAVAQHEFAIVERLLASGQVIEQVIRSAGPERLAAIAAHAEVLPGVLKASDPGTVVAEVHNQVFDRLVEVEYPEATIADRGERDFTTQDAWRRFLSESLEGRVTTGSRTEVFNADPDGYATVLASESAGGLVPSDIDSKVSGLDRIAGLGSVQAGA